MIRAERSVSFFNAMAHFGFACFGSPHFSQSFTVTPTAQKFKKKLNAKKYHIRSNPQKLALALLPTACLISIFYNIVSPYMQTFLHEFRSWNWDKPGKP